MNDSNRRRFLQIAALAAGGTFAAGAVAWRYAMSSAASLYRRLVEMPRNSGRPGKLDDEDAKTLMAVTTALVGSNVDQNRYEDFFRWHAENAPGYREIYERFVRALDRAAARSGGARFSGASLEVQRAILVKAVEVRTMINLGDRTRGFRMALFDRDWLLFERYVVREILTLFARTDAWLLAGYGAHPGLPRGLDAYREPPSGSSSTP